MFTQLRNTLLISALAFPSMALSNSGGLGDLTITPTRVIFEGRDRVQQVSLVNRGSKAATYRIGLIEMHMDDHGTMSEIKRDATSNEFAGENFASDFIRYSPRQVTLEPNIGQTVRLMLRKPANLPDGEYRSHLMMYALPEEGLGADIEALNKDKEDISIQLVPIFRLTIPVIVRHGDLKADFHFSDFSVEEQPKESNQKPKISMFLNREGNRSVYGDVTFTFTPQNKSEEYTVGRIKDFVVYSSNKRRELAYELNLPEQVKSLSGGTIKAVFSSEKFNDHQPLTEFKDTIP